MNILMLGVKEYPYGVSSEFEKHAGGGIAKVVIDLVHELSSQEKNINITLIVRKMPDQLKYEVINNICIYRVSWINSRYLRMPVFALFSFFKALKIAKNYDIIHAHDGFAISISFFIRKFIPNLITVSSPHGGPITSESSYNWFATKTYRWLEKFNIRKSENMVFLSEAEKNQLCGAYKCHPSKSYVIPSGISQICIKKNIEEEAFRLIFIGRLMPRKGLDKLICAISLLPLFYLEKTTLTIVGDGYSKMELVELCNKLALTKNIKFVGFSNNIKAYLADADLFILPSDGGEGLPISVLEAMSAKVPVMISNFDAPFKNNSYYKLDNNLPEVIKNAIIELYNDRSHLKNLSDNAFKEYIEKYSIEAAAKRYFAFYESILKQ